MNDDTKLGSGITGSTLSLVFGSKHPNIYLGLVLQLGLAKNPKQPI